MRVFVAGKKSSGWDCFGIPAHAPDLFVRRIGLEKAEGAPLDRHPETPRLGRRNETPNKHGAVACRTSHGEYSSSVGSR